LKALEEADVPIACIAGNSMGAVIGGLYSAGVSADELARLAGERDLWTTRNSYANQSVFQKRLVRPQAFSLYLSGWEYRLPVGLVNDAGINWTLIEHASPAVLWGDGSFDSLPIPFRTIALDLVSGEEFVFRSGDLARAIRSSMSLPVTFPPVRARRPDRLFVDAGPRSNLPIDLLAEMGANRVIAVNCTQRVLPTDAIEDVTQVASRLVAALSERTDSTQVSGWDIWLEPSVEHLRTNDFDRAEEFIALGYQAAWKAMPRIKALFGSTPPAPRAGGARDSVPDIDAIRRALGPLTVAWVRSEGRRMTYQWVPRTELGLKRGDRLEFDRLRRGVQRLYRTGLYESVWPRLERVAADSVGIVLVLEERNAAYVSVAFLYDNSRLMNVGLEFAYTNLLRLGESSYIDLSLGNHRDALEGGIRSGRLRGVPLAVDLSAHTSRVRYQRSDGGEFLRRSRGFQVRTGVTSGRPALLLVGARVEDDSGEAIGPVESSEEVAPESWRFHQKSVFATAHYDATDQRLLPSRGVRARAEYELIFGETLEGSRQRFSASMAATAPLGSFSVTPEAGFAGLTSESAPFRLRHRLDLTRATLGRLEPNRYAPYTAFGGLTLSVGLAQSFALWAETRGGLWADTSDNLETTRGLWGMQGGLVQRTPIGPLLLGSAFERERSPFYFIQLGHDLPD